MAWLPRRDYDWMLVLGDRFEVLGAVLAAHLLRIPIAHIAGGDRTEGSYDDAMRDCISRLATLHFVTNELSLARLRSMGYSNVHLVGSPGIDYIRHASWDTGSPMKVPYVVVSYQSETIDGTNEIEHVLATLPDKFAVFLLPNPDRGSEAIRTRILAYCEDHDALAYDVLPHDEFLNLLRYADEFIGNSSAIFYEAPELGVPTRLIGKRQRGRVQPWGDGQASERIVKILKQFDLEQVSA
jgi:UDP-N-acetylglucosamine 2-epimerase (non-hydrolysing)/GDP/UDP-N,N'-diacetylbacillosamine 2-epimerase (hydrolysing)